MAGSSFVCLGEQSIHHSGVHGEGKAPSDTVVAKGLILNAYWFVIDLVCLAIAVADLELIIQFDETSDGAVDLGALDRKIGMDEAGEVCNIICPRKTCFLRRICLPMPCRRSFSNQALVCIF